MLLAAGRGTRRWWRQRGGCGATRWARQRPQESTSPPAPSWWGARRTSCRPHTSSTALASSSGWRMTRSHGESTLLCYIHWHSIYLSIYLFVQFIYFSPCLISFHCFSKTLIYLYMWRCQFFTWHRYSHISLPFYILVYLLLCWVQILFSLLFPFLEYHFLCTYGDTSFPTSSPYSYSVLAFNFLIYLCVQLRYFFPFVVPVFYFSLFLDITLYLWRHQIPPLHLPTSLLLMVLKSFVKPASNFFPSSL